MIKYFTAAATAAFMIGGLSPPANAALMLSADIAGTTFTCTDQQVSCDTNPAVGTLQVADQTINGVQFLGSSQQQVIGPTNSLNSSSFQFNNTTANPVALTLAVSGTNFQGPVATFSASGSGTFQSCIGCSIILSYFADNANSQGAENPTDLPGTNLVPGNDTFTATLATQSFAFNHSGAFVDPDLYSMSLGTNVINLIGGGSIVGRNQAIVTSQVTVPEPGSLALLGTGLIFGGIAIRRRGRKHFLPGHGFSAA